MSLRLFLIKKHLTNSCSLNYRSNVKFSKLPFILIHSHTHKVKGYYRKLSLSSSAFVVETHPLSRKTFFFSPRTNPFFFSYVFASWNFPDKISDWFRDLRVKKILVLRRVVIWRRVWKSFLAVSAHSLLFSFTLLLALKLDRVLSQSWWSVSFFLFS